MSAILVILLVVSLFAIDALKLYIKRRNGVAPAISDLRTFSALQFPKGLFLGDNHSWVRLNELGELKLGMDELLTQAVGEVDKVEIAEPGTQLKRGDTLATVTRLGHQFTVTSPVDGTVVAANENAEITPHVVADDPYGRGWLASVWPVEHNEALRVLKVGDRASTWLKRETQRFTDFLTARTSPELVGALAADGAHPVIGAACSLDEEGWKAFEAEFTRIES
jgi:glycine cleavage system H protein